MTLYDVTRKRRRRFDIIRGSLKIWNIMTSSSAEWQMALKLPEWQCLCIVRDTGGALLYRKFIMSSLSTWHTPGVYCVALQMNYDIIICLQMTGDIILVIVTHTLLYITLDVKAFWHLYMPPQYKCWYTFKVTSAGRMGIDSNIFQLHKVAFIVV